MAYRTMLWAGCVLALAGSVLALAGCGEDPTDGAMASASAVADADEVVNSELPGTDEVSAVAAGDRCAPCQVDVDCGDGFSCRLLSGPGTWHCLETCEQGSAVCGDDSFCDVIDGLLVCTPDSGDCPCSEVHAGRSGRCKGNGKCEGSFGCDADGAAIACDAPTPGPEICNGVDDDCSGEVDDDAAGSCDDGSACTLDACLGGQCVYDPAPLTCLIGANCFLDGEVSPSNECLVCASEATAAAWTNVTDGGVCDDGLPCTDSDQCLAGGCLGVTPEGQCDDVNSCTLDGCDPQSGCFNLGLDDVACDDGDTCTTGDQCQAGSCVGIPVVCDDGVDCTLDVCVDGQCAHEQLVVGTCLIDGLCRAEGSHPAGELCQTCLPDSDPLAWTALTGVALCDDGTACTVDDGCVGGLCLSVPVVCDDNNACTLDFCVPQVGCLNQGVSGLFCDDGDPCTANDMCIASACGAGAPVSCDDGNACTADQCEPGVGCVFPAGPNGACDDGDACSLDDACSEGVCSGELMDCKDDKACTDDTCVDGDCQSDVADGACLIDGACTLDGAPNPANPCEGCRPDTEVDQWLGVPPGSGCDDGDACTAGELCQAGACVGGAPVICDDGNPCTADSCEAVGGCLNSPTPGACDDGLFCTLGDSCDLGACSGVPRDCGPLSGPCVLGLCDEGQGACVAQPDAAGAPCDDGLSCTQGDACSPEGVCSGAAAGACCAEDLDCDDGNACTTDTCGVGGVCSLDPTPMNGVGCDDGLLCTTGDACSQGGCAGTPTVCTSDACNQGDCIESLGCTLVPRADGTLCVDDGEICTADICVAGGCTHAPNQAPCDDGDACSFTDACTAGTCTGTAYSCDDLADCTPDVCLADGTCSNAPDPGWCLIGGACTPDGAGEPGNECGVCNSAAAATSWSAVPEGASCSGDGDPCTDDVCSASACTHVFNVAPCDDGEACTAADTCSAGVCLGQGYSCDDGQPCTLDGCDGLGQCTATITAGFCLIDGACYGGGQVSPTEPCKACNQAVSSAEWTSLANGTACDDGNLCTAGEQCLGGGCQGAVVDCDDANLCTDDTCEAAAGCLNTYNSKPCSDGLACTDSDICSEGSCAGSTKDCSSLGDQCSLGECVEAAGGCITVPLEDGNGCVDESVCTGPDTCLGGVCQGPVQADCCGDDLDCDDGNSCTLDTCDTETGQCGNTSAPLDGVACQDGLFCTVSDECAAGACLGLPRDCGDWDGACVIGQCDEAAVACVSAATDEGQPCAEDGNACTDDLCQGGSCSHPNSTATCDDGQECTYGDTCNAGVCAGIIKLCDDGLECTTDSCDGAGGCVFAVQAGTCAIGNGCWADGDVQPTAPCKVCDAAQPGAWSVADDGAGCDDGDACTIGDACQGGECVASGDACAACDGLVAGESCDDSDAATVGDICLSGTCRGFVVLQTQPTGGVGHSFLDDVTWTGDGFYATGGDMHGGGRGWVGRVESDSVVVDEGSALSGHVYVAVSQDVAVTSGGGVADRTSGAWATTGDLATSIASLGHSGTAALWGTSSAATQDNASWYIAGADAGGAWVALCTSGSCSEQPLSFGGFTTQQPRALGGFDEPSKSTTTAYLLADGSYGTQGANQAYRRTIQEGLGTAWANDFYDTSPSSAVSADVHGTGSSNMWWVGSEGLLRNRGQGPLSSSSWTTYAWVLGDSTQQHSTDLTGVWADEDVVLATANKADNGAVVMSLATHAVTTDPAVADNWTMIPLLDLEAVDTDTGPASIGLETPGALTDVWVHQGVVVIVGWVWDTAANARRALVLWRELPSQ